jgi:hypothetical protein
MGRTTVNTNQARRTLTLTSIYLAAFTSGGCGGPAATECAQTATCNPNAASDGGQAIANTTTHGDAATVDAAPAIEPDAITIGASTPQGCKADNDCPADESCCAGQCFNTKTDVKHCGSCSACNVANGAAACTNGACSVATCSQGFVDCDGKADNGCELTQPMGPSAPSPTRPVAGDYTGSFWADAAVNTLRPTFKWTASTPDTCGAVSYQIQLDDSCKPGDIQSCAFASPEVDATVATNSFQPPTALAVQKTQPVGTRYYWRVRACDAAKVCSSWSSVRYVEVGRVRDDLNGDGYSDLLVRGGADDLYIYFGGRPFNNQTPVHGKPGTSFAFGGDIDADGFGDLLVGDPSVSKGGGSYGAILVYLGKATWESELGQHETIYHTADTMMGFPSAVSGAGDFNGDGRADIAASLASDTSISIFLDVAGRYATPGFIKIYNDPGPMDDGFGRAGDVDGDGISDFAVLQESTGNGNSVAFFRGAPSPSNLPMARQKVDGCTMNILRPAGDLDGDGFDDLALAGVSGDVPVSTLVTVRGQANIAHTGGIWSVRKFADDSVAFRGLAAGWDANGDGRSDLYWTAVEGYALLSIPGAAGFNDQSPAVTIDDSHTGSFYGTALAMGDYDGDGLADLAVASTLWHPTGNPTATGAVSIHLSRGSVGTLNAPSFVGFGAALGH